MMAPAPAGTAEHALCNAWPVVPNGTAIRLALPGHYTYNKHRGREELFCEIKHLPPTNKKIYLLGCIVKPWLKA